MDMMKIKNGFRWLIDDFRDTYGERNAISFLIEEIDLTKEDLLELAFEEEDIDAVIANPECIFDKD